jgi:hypothetical protein
MIDPGNLTCMGLHNLYIKPIKYNFKLVAHEAVYYNNAIGTFSLYICIIRSRLPYDLSHGSATARLLELRVRIPPGLSMFCLL